jgi:hypothetical protein
VVLYLADRGYPVPHAVGLLYLHISLAEPLIYYTPRRISTTIMAPTAVLAASFTILARIIHQLGTPYSRLTPKWCTLFELLWDERSLTVVYSTYRHDYLPPLRGPPMLHI